ncbi:MAG: LysE family translocator [Desulfosarcinaceae bacterium]|nr:LysE family translocator [Desulfosarcinaceae bacterium]
MNVEIWLAFLLAAEIILVIPGPTILLVIGQAATHGRTSVAPLVAGVLCGDALAMTLSMAGLGALMATSALLFNILKWIGALYLIYLGVQQWRRQGSVPAVGGEISAAPAGTLWRRAFVVTALNPKSIAFFVAFLPQFIVPGEPVLAQLIVLGITFLVLATVNAALYALFAGQLRETLQQSGVHRWFHRCGAGALIGAGVITAGMQNK